MAAEAKAEAKPEKAPEKEDGKEDDDKPIKTLTEEDVRIMAAYGAGPTQKRSRAWKMR